MSYYFHLIIFFKHMDTPILRNGPMMVRWINSFNVNGKKLHMCKGQIEGKH